MTTNSLQDDDYDLVKVINHSNIIQQYVTETDYIFQEEDYMEA